MSNENNKKYIKASTDISNPNIQDRNEGNLTNWKSQNGVKQLNLYIYIKIIIKKEDERLKH